MDEIRIDNLEVYAHHGVYPEEQEKGQRFYLNAVLFWMPGKREVRTTLRFPWIMARFVIC